ncbi:uncharacterized protein [Paramisgurnus dabryanus]|uniref:uncharacterized protein n=1 Tax=Paramisgurnus dabryanus TaxID=90735 RepID=UPI0031F3B092
MSQSDDDAQGAESNMHDIQGQLRELSRKHEETRAAIANLSKEPSRSYIYVPRERQIQPFSGDLSKDGRNVDEFIEEVERVLLVRNQSTEDQLDFVLSLLRGAALEEVRLRMGNESDETCDLFEYLRAAFREKRSISQLLQTFYSRKQREGEDIRAYSHALSQIQNSILKQSPNAMTNTSSAIRDQFIEGIRDAGLRRELRKLVRDKPESTLIDVRDEALLWFLEDPKPHVTKVVSSRNVVSETPDAQCAAINVPETKPVSLEDVLKIVAEQGKVIGELTKAVEKLTAQGSQSEPINQTRPKMQPRFTEDGQPICFRCNGVGHIARRCVRKNRQTVAETATTPVPPGNAHPRLL